VTESRFNLLSSIKIKILGNYIQKTVNRTQICLLIKKTLKITSKDTQYAILSFWLCVVLDILVKTEGKMLWSKFVHTILSLQIPQYKILPLSTKSCILYTLSLLWLKLHDHHAFSNYRVTKCFFLSSLVSFSAHNKLTTQQNKKPQK